MNDNILVRFQVKNAPINAKWLNRNKHRLDLTKDEVLMLEQLSSLKFWDSNLCNQICNTRSKYDAGYLKQRKTQISHVHQKNLDNMNDRQVFLLNEIIRLKKAQLELITNPPKKKSPTPSVWVSKRHKAVKLVD
jgi:hypothetical protein